MLAYTLKRLVHVASNATQQTGPDAFWENLPQVAKSVLDNFERKYNCRFESLTCSDDQVDIIQALQEYKTFTSWLVSQRTATYTMQADTIEEDTLISNRGGKYVARDYALQQSENGYSLIDNSTHRFYAHFLTNLTNVMTDEFTANNTNTMPLRNTEHFFIYKFLPTCIQDMHFETDADGSAILHLHEPFFRKLRALQTDIDTVIAIVAAFQSAFHGLTPRRWKLYQS